jgi:hypothetical protein
VIAKGTGVIGFGLNFFVEELKYWFIIIYQEPV